MNDILIGLVLGSMISIILVLYIDRNGLNWWIFRKKKWYKVSFSHIDTVDSMLIPTKKILACLKEKMKKEYVFIGDINQYSRTIAELACKEYYSKGLISSSIYCNNIERIIVIVNICEKSGIYEIDVILGPVQFRLTFVIKITDKQPKRVWLKKKI